MKSNLGTKAAPDGEIKASTYLGTGSRQENRAWLLWYSFTSPREPPKSASFQHMERFRRGRIGSQIILALYILLLISTLAGFVGANKYLFSIVGVVACLLLVATGLNRMGKVNLAGSLVVLAFILYPVAAIITDPNGLSILALPLYGLLVLPLLCTVSFLPPWWVFMIASGNSLFTWISLTYMPRTAELNTLLNIALASTMIPIILIQLLVAVVAYAWVHNTTQALLRADRAEEIAKLERDLALQAEEAARQKQQLEANIQAIVNTHVRVANGDFSARVPLAQNNVLWQIAGPLNNLIARAYRWRLEVLQLKQELLLHQQPGKHIERSRDNHE